MCSLSFPGLGHLEQSLVQTMHSVSTSAEITLNQTSLGCRTPIRALGYLREREHPRPVLSRGVPHPDASSSEYLQLLLLHHQLRGPGRSLLPPPSSFPSPRSGVWPQNFIPLSEFLSHTQLLPAMPLPSGPHHTLTRNLRQLLAWPGS